MAWRLNKKASFAEASNAIIPFPVSQVKIPRRKDNEMQQYVYRVDPRMIPPVVMTMGFGAFLIILEGATRRGFLVSAILLPFYYLGAEILARKIILSTDGVTVHKFLRSVHINWNELHGLDALRTGRKAFLILQCDQSGPVLITNTIRPFDNLLRELIEMLPAEKISEAARDLLEAPPSKYGPLIQAWIVCLLLLGIIVGKLLGYG